MTLGRHEPENVPMRLEMLRRTEIVCGGSDESMSKSDTRFLASLMTERSTPLPLTAPCCKCTYTAQVREQSCKGRHKMTVKSLWFVVSSRLLLECEYWFMADRWPGIV